MEPPPPAPSFTLTGLRQGAVGVAALVPNVAMYGVAFGIMSGAAGLSSAEAILFSAWINAGGAQMASLQAWSEPVSLLAVCLTTLAMNSRYLLLGAALRPWFRGIPAWQSYPSLFVMGDGNWTLALRRYDAGGHDAAFLLGSGVVLWVIWVGATAVGHGFGQVLGRPERFGLDFMLAAFFAAMAAVFVRRVSAIAPLIVGAVTAVVVERLVPGPWYILAGALLGSLVGAVRPVHAA